MSPRSARLKFATVVLRAVAMSGVPVASAPVASVPVFSASWGESVTVATPDARPRVAVPTTSDGGRGSVSSTFRSISYGPDDSSLCGRNPVSSSYKTTPIAYTSVAVVIASPRTCSGAAYPGVITFRPVAVRPGASASSIFAIPKSSSFTRPSSDTNTFDGLRSRCTIRF